MSGGRNTPGISKFVGAIKDMMQSGGDGMPTFDFGVIQSNGSLLTNQFPIEIPKGDYIICRHLKARTVTETTSSASVGDHGSHSHSVEVSTRQALATGDRVLVAWVDNDAVVIDVILDADEVL